MLVFDEEAAEVITLGALLTRTVYRAALKLVNGTSSPPYNCARDPSVAPPAKGMAVVEHSGETKKRGAEEYGDYEGHLEKRARLTEPAASRGNAELASVNFVGGTGESDGEA